MLQSDNVKLFKNILQDFNTAGILLDFILIGSWSLRVYSQYFQNDPGVPIVATQDLDLLVPNPPKMSHEIDISSILKKYDLEQTFSPQGYFSKFVGDNFEVEFLYPEKGRGERGGKFIKELGITATPLRYLNYIQSNIEVMEYDSIPLKVPNPEAFVLMKYLLVTERSSKDTLKISKDIDTAKEFEFFLLEKQRGYEFIDHYKNMPKKWRKKIMMVLEENKSELLDLLKDFL